MLLAVSLKLIHSKPVTALRIRLNLPFLKVTLSWYMTWKIRANMH